MQEDKFRESRQLSDKAIKLEPREALFHALSGDIHAAKREFRKAELAYNDAVKLDSGFFYHYLRRGQVRYERRRFEQARIDLEHSLELLPTGDAHFMLGNLDRRSGNLDSAIKHYQQAAQSGSEQAQRELVLLELPSNPGKYVQSKAALGQDGYVNAAVRNSSPVTVGGIKVKVEYVDPNGKLREFTMTFRQTFKPGEWAALPTKIRDIAGSSELQRRVRVTVIAARVIEEQSQQRSRT